jgi:hypothetical protein
LSPLRLSTVAGLSVFFFCFCSFDRKDKGDKWPGVEEPIKFASSGPPSRPLCGYVVSGFHSFARGQGFATGFVVASVVANLLYVFWSSSDLPFHYLYCPHLFFRSQKQQILLIRNPSAVQYRAAAFRLTLDSV